jgi:hypothetical protein
MSCSSELPRTGALVLGKSSYSQSQQTVKAPILPPRGSASRKRHAGNRWPHLERVQVVLRTASLAGLLAWPIESHSSTSGFLLLEWLPKPLPPFSKMVILRARLDQGHQLSELRVNPNPCQNRFPCSSPTAPPGRDTCWKPMSRQLVTYTTPPMPYLYHDRGCFRGAVCVCGCQKSDLSDPTRGAHVVCG